MKFRNLALFGAILFIDLISKYLVAHHIPLFEFFRGFPFGGISILNTALMKISIVHTTNAGTAWGLFSNFQVSLLLFRMAITAGILIYLFFFNTAKRLELPLFCIAAGALGNILDFFLYGHVIDMIYCIFYKYSYPVFNVADSAIFCSVIYLMFASKKKTEQSHVPSA